MEKSREPSNFIEEKNLLRKTKVFISYGWLHSNNFCIVLNQIKSLESLEMKQHSKAHPMRLERESRETSQHLFDNLNSAYSTLEIAIYVLRYAMGFARK